MQFVKIVFILSLVITFNACADREVITTTTDTNDPVPTSCESDSECASELACAIGICDTGTNSCTYTAAAGTCLIDGECYESGQAFATLPCQECRPALDSSAFSDKACGEGETCDTASGECVSGSSEACGNGTIEGSEGCDDGNTAEGDGCSGVCESESGWECPTSGEACTDIDECAAEQSPCGENSVCTNTEGGYDCACADGYTATDDGACEDIDECAAEQSPCGENTVCTNIDGNYDCACADGYTATDDGACEDIDECAAEQSPCGENTVCTNTEGGVECPCAEGFAATDDGACDDIDECAADPSPCGENTVCTNTEGGVECPCAEGFAATDDGTCVDVDECAAEQSPCGENTVCTNTEGGVECPCADGFAATDDGTCVDVDECAAEQSPCGENSVCTNTEGGVECPCADGFAATDDGTCVDVDECVADDLCDGNQVCNNLPGSYACGCVEGYTPKPADFEEVPCATHNDCKIGYGCNKALDNGENEPLTDEDECDVDGECTCLPLDECIDLDECSGELSPCPVNTECTNTDGGFECACAAGFIAGDNGACEDVDECADGTFECDVNATCVNTPGSYLCECNEGYEGDGLTCCAIGVGYSPCGPQKNIPVNTVTGGGWSLCYQGEYGDLLSAASLDECAGEDIMFACRPKGQGELTLLAWAPKADVLKDTGPPGIEENQNTDVGTISNGSRWYFSDSPGTSSMGFAKASDKIRKHACDVEATGDGSVRLCWHLSANFGGFRCGETLWLNDSIDWERVVYVR
jgi:hypothetical protein